LATLMGLGHVLWSVLLATGMTKPMIDWMLSLHSINVSYSLTGFDPVNAVILVVVAVIKGYVVGYLFGYVWNRVAKSKL